MKSRNEMLKEGLSAIDPLADASLEMLASDSEELLAAVLASSPDETSGSRTIARRRRAPRKRRGRLLVAMPVVAAALLASVVGIPGGGQSGPATLPALAKAAEAAAAQPAPNADLPYVYMKTQQMGTDTSVAGGEAWSVYDSTIKEEWVAEDGSGRVRRIAAAPKWVSPKDREAWEAAGSIEFLHDWSAHTEEEDAPAGRLGYPSYDGTKLSELPTDPAELTEWLIEQVSKSHNGFSPAVRSLALVSEILTDPFATPELRAALYEAEGLVPGIEYFGPTADAIGRHGLAIGAESANSGAPTRYLLIFDPGTSQVLATESITLKPPSGLPNEPTPLLSEGTMFLDFGTTSSLTSRP